MNGQAVGGALGCGLVIGSFGALGLGNDGGSGRIRGDGLEAAKGALDVCQTFIGADGRGGIDD